MALKKVKPKYVYGAQGSSPILTLPPEPVVEKAATFTPTTTDTGVFGQIVVVPATQTAFICVDEKPVSGNWQAITGSTTLTPASLTVTAGPTTLNYAAAENGVLVTNASGVVSSTSGSTTSVLLGAGVGSTPAFGAVTSTGGTIAITRSGANLNLEFSGALTPYTTVTGATTALVENTGYLINYAGVATLNLPAVTAVGQVIEIQQLDTTVGRGHQIALNGNTLVYGGQTPTTLTFTNTAASGSTAANLYGNICLISIAVNTWAVFGQPMGTYVVA